MEQPTHPATGARTPRGDATVTGTASSRRRGDPAPGARRGRSRLVRGVLTGLAVMAVAALGYGALLRVTMSGGGGYHEFSFAALALGLAVGAATGLAGGRSAA